MPKVIKTEHYKYLTNDDWRTLVSVEMGMKNHELVPLELIHRISKVQRRGSNFEKILKSTLVPYKLVAYEQASKGRCGYRLTNQGYDYLGLRQLIKSGQLSDLCHMIGAGKESDVYIGLAGETCGRQDDEPVEGKGDSGEGLPHFGEAIIIKFHRLGRTSFRKVKEKRAYHQHRNNASWLYLDRLAAAREFAMMKALHTAGLPVPRALACNRSAVVMEYLTDAVPLSRMATDQLIANAASLFKQASDALVRISSLGLVHGDLNEFNLMVIEKEAEDEEGTSTVEIRVIDFPQMISRDHSSAEEQYCRDRKGVMDFFKRYYVIPKEDKPPKSLSDIERVDFIDVNLRAPGYPKKHGNGRRTEGVDEALLEQFSSVSFCDAHEDSSEEEEGSDVDGEEEETSADQPQGAVACGGEEEVDSEEEEEGDDNSEDESDGEKVNEKGEKIKQVRVATKKGVMPTDYVKERVRREKQKEKEKHMYSRIRRQNRAATKQKGRLNMKSELDW